MKKLLFTAIALVAFSSASMANTIADENIIENKKESIEIEVSKDYNKIVVKKKSCIDAALDYYEAVIGDGPDDIDLLQQLLARCK